MIEIPNTVEEYRTIRNDYEELAERVDYILFEILGLEKINYALIENRAKSVESFKEKIESKKNHILYDLAGIRIVGYVRSDIEKIVEIVRKNFIVDESKSKNKSLELDPDRFGYRAIHLICKLPNERLILPEYKKFKDMYFEIQIKTILEHAWAAIEHDRNYKYKGLPNEIKRDFYLISGILETADKNFESINKRIEDYDKSIQVKTQEGRLNEIELNPATLKRYLIDKFSNVLIFEPKFGDFTGDAPIKELSALGIKNIQDLENAIPENFVKVKKIWDEQRGRTGNLSQLVFTILLCSFGKKCEDILSKTRMLTALEFEKYMSQLEAIKNSLIKS